MASRKRGGGTGGKRNEAENGSTGRRTKNDEREITGRGYYDIDIGTSPSSGQAPLAARRGVPNAGGASEGKRPFLAHEAHEETRGESPGLPGKAGSPSEAGRLEDIGAASWGHEDTYGIGGAEEAVMLREVGLTVSAALVEAGEGAGRKAGYPAGFTVAARRGSDAMIGKVQGVAGVNDGRSLRDVSIARGPVQAFYPVQPPLEPEPVAAFLPASAADRELMPPAPPELAEKLLGLIEKVVEYKDRLAQEQAARRMVEERLREMHTTVLGGLRAEVRAYEDAAVEEAERSAARARRALGGAAAAESSPLFDEAAQQAGQVALGRAAAAALKAGKVPAVKDDEGDEEVKTSTDTLALAALARRGLGGGVQADVASTSLAARLQPDPDRHAAALTLARAVLDGKAARARADARAVLLEGVEDAEGEDVVLASLGAGVEGLGSTDEVEGALAAEEEDGSASTSVTASYPQWLERQRQRARRRAWTPKEAEGPKTVVALGPYSIVVGAKSLEGVGWQAKAYYELSSRGWRALAHAGHVLSYLTSSRALPLRDSVTRISFFYGSTTGTSFSLHRQSVLLFILLAFISTAFSLHHWVFGSFASSDKGTVISASMLAAFLPSSYTTKEGGLLAGQLVILFGAAIAFTGRGWVQADRRAKAHAALTGLAGNPSYSRAVFGAVDVRGYSSAVAAAEARFSAGDELSALLQDDVLKEVAAARSGAAPLLVLIGRRLLGALLYTGVLLWLLYLTAQLMMGTSMLHRIAVGTGTGAELKEASGAGWTEALAPAGVGLLLWFIPRILVLISGLEAWGSHHSYMTALTLRLWLAHVSAALLQVLGYILIADPALMRAPSLSFMEAFPALTADKESVYQQLLARAVLARPFIPSLVAGGTACRLDAATAGLVRLLVAHFLVVRAGSVLAPVWGWVTFRLGRCSKFCAVVFSDSPSVIAAFNNAGVNGQAVLRTAYRAPEHSPAAATAELAHFLTLGLASLLFAPLVALLAAVLAILSYALDEATLWSCRSRPRRPWPGSGRAAAPLFHAILTVTTVIVGCLFAGLLTSVTIPAACGVSTPVHSAAYTSTPALSAIVRNSDPYCTAVNDTMPLYAASHGWIRTGLNKWEVTSPWMRAAAVLPLAGSAPEQRRTLMTTIAGEEVLYWYDHACVPQCTAAQVAYISNHTALDDDLVSDVFSSGTWCTDHCSTLAGIMPQCPLQALPAYVNASTGGLSAAVAAPVATFLPLWSEAYTPVDSSVRKSPFGLAGANPTVMMSVDLTRPCDLACGAWVDSPSGAVALRNAFVMSGSGVATFLWVAAHSPMLLWLALLAALVAWAHAANSRDVEAGLSVERTATVVAGMQGMRRTVAALQRRVRKEDVQQVHDERF
jgi:hypothetical protein